MLLIITSYEPQVVLWSGPDTCLSLTYFVPVRIDELMTFNFLDPYHFYILSCLSVNVKKKVNLFFSLWIELLAFYLYFISLD